MPAAKETTKFSWPLWHFAAVLVPSAIYAFSIRIYDYPLFPLLKPSCAIGYVLVGLVYLRGRFKTGGRIGWAICLVATLFMWPIVDFVVSEADAFI